MKQPMPSAAMGARRSGGAPGSSGPASGVCRDPKWPGRGRGRWGHRDRRNGCLRRNERGDLSRRQCRRDRWAGARSIKGEIVRRQFAQRRKPQPAARRERDVSSATSWCATSQSATVPLFGGAGLGGTKRPLATGGGVAWGSRRLRSPATRSRARRRGEREAGMVAVRSPTPGKA